jgi:hypothetical protein
MAFWVFGHDAVTKEPRNPIESDVETEAEARALATRQGMEVEFVEPAYRPRAKAPTESQPSAQASPGGGQGRVRVTATTGITASAPDLAERGSPSPPDTAITDQCPPARGEPLEVPHPAPGTCPRCGSASFKRLKAQRGVAFKNDRQCKKCGTPYTTILAPMSITVQEAMYASGVLLILGGIVPALVWLAGAQGPGRIGERRARGTASSFRCCWASGC